MEPKIDIPQINGIYDLDALQQHFMKGGVIKHNSLVSLLRQTITILREEPNVLYIDNDVIIHGDYHGQYFDFIQHLNEEKAQQSEEASPQLKKLYLGDYVDRGQFSTEILITLFCMKCNNPKGIFILRGNHETRSMNKSMGFLDEVKRKYSFQFFYDFNDVFDALPLAAIVKRKIGSFFTCHGGISPDFQDIDDLNSIDRFREPPIRSNLFGYRAIKNFLMNNDFKLLIRGHQCFVEGAEQHFFGSSENFPMAITVFGAANYSLGNVGSTLALTNSEIHITTYPSSPLLKLYSPVLLNPFESSIDTLMASIKGIMESMFYYENTENDFEQIDNFNTTSLLPSKINENTEKMWDEARSNLRNIVKTISHAGEYEQDKSLFCSFDDRKESTFGSNLFASVESESPTIYGKRFKTRIREEVLPLSLNQIRKRFPPQEE
ncbi:Serine/threonine-protein phosphatase [Entamoeba marina]